MDSPSDQQRLQKILARAGIASRRQAERMIVDGRVRVNGEVRSELGAKADPERDRISVDGTDIAKSTLRAASRRVLLLHKPRGVMCTRSDPQQRKTIYDFLPPGPLLSPVGRLDYNSEGALLLTRDGELAQALMSPRLHVPKLYEVKVHRELGAEALAQIREGMFLDGRQTRPIDIELLGAAEGSANNWYHFVLTEGRRRQIRRMIEGVGSQVMRLKRVGIGPIRLGELPPGAWRDLAPAEIQDLRQAAGLPAEVRKGPRRPRLQADRSSNDVSTSAKPSSARSSATKSSANRSSATNSSANRSSTNRSSASRSSANRSSANRSSANRPSTTKSSERGERSDRSGRTDRRPSGGKKRAPRRR